MELEYRFYESFGAGSGLLQVNRYDDGRLLFHKAEYSRQQLQMEY